MFENRALRKIFEPQWAEVTGSWRKLHNKELHNLCSSPNAVRVIKSRNLSWAGHVARTNDNKGGLGGGTGRKGITWDT
jgi:hypothetical protein